MITVTSISRVWAHCTAKIRFIILSAGNAQKGGKWRSGIFSFSVIYKCTHGKPRANWHCKWYICLRTSSGWYQKLNEILHHRCAFHFNGIKNIPICYGHSEHIGVSHAHLWPDWNCHFCILLIRPPPEPTAIKAAGFERPPCQKPVGLWSCEGKRRGWQVSVEHMMA